MAIYLGYPYLKYCFHVLFIFFRNSKQTLHSLRPLRRTPKKTDTVLPIDIHTHHAHIYLDIMRSMRILIFTGQGEYAWEQFLPIQKQ